MQTKWYQRRLVGTSAKHTALVWQVMFCSTLLWAWLIPNRYIPLSEFYNDWWIAACLGITLWTLIYRDRCGTASWPLPTIIIACSAAIPVIQWACGLIPTRGQATLSALYLLGVGLAFWGGWAWHLKIRWRALDILFAAILCAALINVGIVLIQFFGLYPYDDTNFPGILIFQIAESSRPTGNLAQANVAGTHFIWGLLALWWFAARTQLRWPVLLFASTYLLLAVAFTQSRTAWINLIFLPLATGFFVWKWRRRGFEIPNKFWLVQPLLWVLVLAFWLLVIELMSDHLGLGAGIRKSVFQDSGRIAAYMTFVKAVTLSPWLGYGMTHLTSAQMMAAPDGVELGVYFFHSHNIALDFLLWFGVPLGLVGLSGLLWLLIELLKRVNTAHTLVVAMLILVFGVHALFELPHMWGIMLFPVAWCSGALWAVPTSPKNVPGRNIVRAHRIPKLAVLSLCSAMTIGLAAIINDYQMVLREFWTLRMDDAGIGPRGLDRIEPTIFLNHLENRLRLARLSDRDLQEGKSIEWIAQASRGYPSPSTHFLYIKALALRGSIDEAKVEMQKLNRATSQELLRQFVKNWSKFQALHPDRDLPPWVISGALLAGEQNARPISSSAKN